MSRKWKNILGGLAVFTLLSGIIAVVGGLYILYSFGRDLPDYKQLADYEPPVVSRVYAGDGSLIKEYAREKRLFVPINAIPPKVIQAFLSAEDQNFYTHIGIDFKGLLRAVLVNVKNVITNRRPVGASTITQQVAKNFLLTNEVRFERKIKEAILSYRIEQTFSKDQILELYLNEIYLGQNSYGVAAAALNYFGKSLDELEVQEIAYLAALPKAPSNYHPVRRYNNAVGRRDWVLGRMEIEGFITEEEKLAAQNLPLGTVESGRARTFQANYFAEDVRRELKKTYGDDELYGGGLAVRSSLSPRLQAIAEREMKNGLVTYDRRHGWRGPLGNMDIFAAPYPTWKEEFIKKRTPLGVDSWQEAVVVDVNDEVAIIATKEALKNSETFEALPKQSISLAEVKWARKWLPGERRGPQVESVTEVLAQGDIIAVEAIETEEPSIGSPFGLRQIPEINGALVALDPHTGRVLAMVGGYDFTRSEYNRATQAKRQPGSAFKPFVYSVALEQGFTPSSLVLDAPFVIDQGYGMGKWKPRNSSNKFYGPSTLRLGIEKSRNLMTVRIAQNVKMENVVEVAERFGITEDMPDLLSMSLGAGETTLLDLTAAYGMIVNGGKKIEPSLIDRIQDRYGNTIYRHDDRACVGCVSEEWQYQNSPELPDERDDVLDPVTSYQLVSMMEGVVQRGTGVRIRALRRPLAGKTGTTDDSFDTWFVGFSPDMVVGVFVGFDAPRSLGRGEEGSSVAVPIFRDFMRDALKDEAPTPFRIPEGVRLVRVDATTGQLAGAGAKNTILEAFRQGSFPTKNAQVLDGFNSLVQTKTKLNTGTGGIY
ncbi:penicillin-binding protein 1A [Pseudemcibacter aquimaris]|uniref:penicillin-binding protein 1A n=1 Tax=Pseudemcibacter aquimaris TaxID=2857064 RepID=UPI002011224B|nr:penicillin-binding protein 1A [Pseudemcibacter aquimaris]MCC3860905.1 penicillin-binding protein 1A [Pseudemcibacter aquimaris]WDU59724.1 penicillin-binding protein 1A [Pseudemcibacter aquimaris]